MRIEMSKAAELLAYIESSAAHGRVRQTTAVDSRAQAVCLPDSRLSTQIGQARRRTDEIWVGLDIQNCDATVAMKMLTSLG